MGKEHEEFSGAILKPEPVVAVTVTCVLGGERQLNLAAHFERDLPPDEQNKILDQVMKIADRQKARYDLEKLEENFNIVGMNTRNFILAVNGAEMELKQRVERMKAELAGKQEAKDAIYKSAYAGHNSTGRRGDFKLRGSDLQKSNLADAEIRKLQDAIEAAPKDAEQQRAVSVGTVQRNQEDLRIRRKQINDLRMLAGLSPNTEFEDAENAKV